MTKQQLKVFWGLVRNLSANQGLSKEDAEDCARNVIQAVSGQRSTKAVSERQGGEVLRRFRAIVDQAQQPAIAGIQPQRPAAPGVRAQRSAASDVRGGGPSTAPTTTNDVTRDVNALPTQNQMDTLARLRKALGWTPDRYHRFCKSHSSCNHPWPQTRAEANAITEALKDMVARQDRSKVAKASFYRRELLKARDQGLYLSDWEQAFLARIEKKRMTVLQKMKVAEIYANRATTVNLGGE